MRNRRPVARRAGAVALALAAIAGSSFPGAALSVEQAPVATCAGGWMPTDPSGLLGSTAVDVTYLNGRPWVAGSAVLEARRPSTFTASGSVEAWASVKLAPTAGSSVLTAIAADGRNGLWAAGEVVGALTQPLIEQWNGRRWLRDSVPFQRNGGALTDIGQIASAGIAPQRNGMAAGGAGRRRPRRADCLLLGTGRHDLGRRVGGHRGEPATPVGALDRIGLAA